MGLDVVAVSRGSRQAYYHKGVIILARITLKAIREAMERDIAIHERIKEEWIHQRDSLPHGSLDWLEAYTKVEQAAARCSYGEYWLRIMKGENIF